MNKALISLIGHRVDNHAVAKALNSKCLHGELGTVLTQKVGLKRVLKMDLTPKMQGQKKYKNTLESPMLEIWRK